VGTSGSKRILSAKQKTLGVSDWGKSDVKDLNRLEAIAAPAALGGVGKGGEEEAGRNSNQKVVIKIETKSDK